MREGFIALAVSLRGEPERAAPVPASDEPPSVAERRDVSSIAGLVDAIGRARLAAFEAYDRSVEELLATFGRDVLGRELLLGPADVAALVQSALARFHAHEPVSLVAAAADAASLQTCLPVRIDPNLAAGDLIVEVRDGAFESPLAFRLDAAVRAAVDAAR